MDTGLLLVKALIFGMIFTGVLGFLFINFMSKNTEGAVSRLNKETEAVRAKQVELNVKIKEANEELTKRKSEADALAAKMALEAEEKAKEEREKIIKKARQESEDIITKAQKTKDDIRRVVVKEMELKTVDFAIRVLGEILSQRALEALDECLILEFIENLTAVDMTMIGPEVTGAEVVTVGVFADRHRTSLAAMLKSKLEREITLTASQDKEMVAGIILKFGSLTLDASLRTLLRDKGMEFKDRVERGML